MTDVSRASVWRSKRLWSLLWAFGLLALTLSLVFKERAQVAQALPLLWHADLWILAVTASCEVVFFVLQAVAAFLLFRLYGKKTRVTALTALLFIATMINEVLPTAGVSGTAGFIYWCERLGYGLRDSLAVNIWMTVLSYLALVPVALVCVRAVILLPGVPGRLIANMLELAVLFVGLIALAIFLVYRIAKRMSHRQNTVAPPLDMENSTGIRYYVLQRLMRIWRRARAFTASHTTRELSKEWRQARHHPVPLLLSTLLLASIYAVRIIMLRLCMHAIGNDLSWSHALFVYCLTLMFSVVSLAPTTLGVVELALTTTMSWFGVPLPAAVAGTVLYRLSSFWLPIPVGLLCQWTLGKQVNWRAKSDS
ncbi:MAG: lysylphosphatidylglycerol synthase transmembrane domain-containing protein [Firmicutes bacterium]|nr:lysylphosphatidylglycerol synthase transmembrane domain-containing protein [Bacillota bacterium]